MTILLFVDEPQSPHAWRLFWRLTEPDPLLFFAPDLLYAECANILWKYSRRFGYSPRQAMENLRDLAKLHIESVSTKDLYRKAYGLALKQGVTVYDACYVVLAQTLSCPLITIDQGLIERIPQATADVRPLADYVAEGAS